MHFDEINVLGKPELQKIKNKNQILFFIYKIYKILLVLKNQLHKIILCL